jgi:hypothetical protein
MIGIPSPSTNQYTDGETPKDGDSEISRAGVFADSGGVTFRQAVPFMETPFSGTTSRHRGCARQQRCWGVRMWTAAMLGINLLDPLVTLWQANITMENHQNHHVLWVNPLFRLGHFQ